MEPARGGDASRTEEVSVVDQDGFLLVNWSKMLGHYMPEVFAVDINAEREKFPRNALKSS